MESGESEPQLLEILAPNEAVVAFGAGVPISAQLAVMNIGVPSMLVNMLRARFDQQ